MSELKDKIILGDCLDKEKGLYTVPEGIIDLIITDVPFGVNFQNSKYYDDSKETVFKNIDTWIKGMYRVLKPNCHFYCYVPVKEIDKWVYHIKKYFKYNNKITASTYTTNRYIKNKFCFDSQDIIYASKGKAKRLNKVDWIETSDSWIRDKRNKSPKKYTYQYPSFLPKKYRANIKPNDQIKLLHPNQKNQELIEKFILLSSKEGDLILDPFMGIGSVCICAKRLNRFYIGYEIERKYFEIAKHLLATIKPIRNLNQFLEGVI